MADEKKIQTNAENISVSSENVTTGPYVVNKNADVTIGIEPQPVSAGETVVVDPEKTVEEDVVETEKSEEPKQKENAETTTETEQKDEKQQSENAERAEEISKQEELNNQMWAAVMDLNRLQTPVEPEVGEDGKMPEYHQGEMAGSEEEIEEARTRLFDALDKGADINAIKETGAEKETILNYVVDADLADDLRAQGAKVAGSLEEHRADVNWFKKEIARAETPEEKAYAEDMLAIHENMVDYLHGEKAYEVYNEMFDEQTGVFEFKGDEKHPLIQVKGNLSQEQRNDLAEALTFFAQENGTDAQKTAGFRKLIDSENGKKILDVNLGAMLVGEYDKYAKAQEEAENEEIVDEVENAQETAEEAVEEVRDDTSENVTETSNETEAVNETAVPVDENEATNDIGITDTNIPENEPAFTAREGVEGETGCLGAPQNADTRIDEMDANTVGAVSGGNTAESESMPARTELHQLADKSNPDDFAWATEAAKNVIADHPEYLNAKSNDQYGVTAMMCVVNKGNVAMLNTLLEKGADVNIPNEYGETALMYAAYHGDMLMMKKLIENGADMTKVAAPNSNYAGQDFLGILAANGHEDMLPAVMEMVKGNMQNAVNSVRQENADLQGQMGASIQPNVQENRPVASQEDVSSADLAAELAMLSAQASKLKAEVDGAKKEKSSLVDKLRECQVGSPDVPKSPKNKIDLRHAQASTGR